VRGSGIIAAVALSVAASAAYGAEDRTGVYASCLTTHLLQYGRGNAESVETLLKVARPKCETEYQALKQEAEGDALVEKYANGVIVDPMELLSKKIEKAEGIAIEALLSARASKAERG